jgi:VIT1/CCC1 family predicted Fe2+/Mn2+ transporter
MAPLESRAPERTREEALRELRQMQERHAQGTGGGRLRAAIFGINDGLVTNASLVVGVAAAGAPDHATGLPDVALDLMAREELGLNPADLGSPWGAAMSSFLAFSAGAAVPLVPYIVLSGQSALVAALFLAGLVITTVGALTARLGQRSPLFGAARALLIGAIATGVTYVVGRIVGVAVT